MVELAYSFHIGNDKNKTKKAKQKNTPTNYNNNAIQNAMQLSKVNHHNLRQYDNNPEKIKTLYGSNDIVKDVKELYKQEFEEARLEYNSKQTRDDRKIKDYYSKISNDTKHDLAVEIIIELGDMDYWWDKDDKEMYKMENSVRNSFIVIVIFIISFLAGVFSRSTEISKKEEQIQNQQTEINQLKEEINILRESNNQE